MNDITFYNLNSTPTPISPVQPLWRQWAVALLACGIVLACVALLTVAVFVHRVAIPKDPLGAYQAYLLPPPKPLYTLPIRATTSPYTVVGQPVVVVMPRHVVRPSVWEIRAQLKRGLGEYEFPHYVNAPQYGWGPDTPSVEGFAVPAEPHHATISAE